MMKTASSLAAAAFLVVAPSVSATSTITATIAFADDSCANPTVVLYTAGSDSCSAISCMSMAEVACPSDWFDHSKTTFSDSSYLLFELYADTTCSGSATTALAFKTDSCVSADSTTSYKVTVSDGEMSLYSYSNADCSGSADATVSATSSELSANTCVSGYKFYSESADSSSSSSSGSGSASKSKSSSASAVASSKTAGYMVGMTVGVLAAAEYL